jgi:hypothetical protein
MTMINLSADDPAALHRWLGTWFRIQQSLMEHQSSVPVLIAALILSACALVWTRMLRADTPEIAVGEEHEMAFPVDQTLELVEDVLRGEGILFDVVPDQSQIVTLWKPADNPAGFFHSLANMKPQYRYEITVVPEGGAKSKVIVNVRTQYVPEQQIAQYKASRRFNMFQKLDQLANDLPPERRTPSTGGVNFALLPNEDLRGLAKRVTGDPDNWKAIADRNGLKSPTDVTPFQTIWVPNNLIKAKPRSRPSEERDTSD